MGTLLATGAQAPMGISPCRGRPGEHVNIRDQEHLIGDRVRDVFPLNFTFFSRDSYTTCRKQSFFFNKNKCR